MHDKGKSQNSATVTRLLFMADTCESEAQTTFPLSIPTRQYFSSSNLLNLPPYPLRPQMASIPPHRKNKKKHLWGGGGLVTAGLIPRPVPWGLCIWPQCGVFLPWRWVWIRALPDGQVVAVRVWSTACIHFHKEFILVLQCSLALEFCGVLKDEVPDGAREIVSMLNNEKLTPLQCACYAGVAMCMCVDMCGLHLGGRAEEQDEGCTRAWEPTLALATLGYGAPPGPIVCVVVGGGGGGKSVVLPLPLLPSPLIGLWLMGAGRVLQLDCQTFGKPEYPNMPPPIVQQPQGGMTVQEVQVHALQGVHPPIPIGCPLQRGAPVRLLYSICVWVHLDANGFASPQGQPIHRRTSPPSSRAPLRKPLTCCVGLTVEQRVSRWEPGRGPSSCAIPHVEDDIQTEQACHEANGAVAASRNDNHPATGLLPVLWGRPGHP